MSLEKIMQNSYLHFEYPHRILKDKTLEEAFTGEKPQVSHFHVFGCPIILFS